MTVGKLYVVKHNYTIVFDYIEFSKFHTQNGDDTLPRFNDGVYEIQAL